MANKAISELPQALNVNNQDLFVIEQGGLAKKLPAETLITEQGIIDALAEALDGHGGIQSITLQSVSGRIRTYLITFTDQSAATFEVLDGTSISGIQKTSTAGLVDTYTIFLNDGTTGGFFQVRNGQDGSATWDQINSKAPVITDTATGATASFPDGAGDMPMKSLVVDIEPVQSGSGDPSPSNIRPITGVDSVTVNRTGTNLVNQDVLLLGTSWTYSQNIPTYKGAPVYTGTLANLCGHGKPLADEIPVTFEYEENTRYRVRLWWRRATPSTANGIRIGVQYTDGTTETSGNQSNNTEDFKRHGLLTAANKTVSKFYFTYNSSSNVYIAGFCIEKYDGTQVEGDTAVVGNELQTITVPLEETCYGGEFDVLTGALTVTNGYIASYDGETLPSTWISDRDVYAPDTTPTTGAEVVYKLDTPQTYQVTTGQQINTLKGRNNVWANAGDAAVEYRADTELHLEKDQLRRDGNLAYVETSSTASRAYSVGDFFVNEDGILCEITASVSSGGTLIEGTNYTVIGGNGGLGSAVVSKSSFAFDSATQTLTITVT